VCPQMRQAMVPAVPSANKMPCAFLQPASGPPLVDLVAQALLSLLVLLLPLLLHNLMVMLHGMLVLLLAWLWQAKHIDASDTQMGRQKPGLSHSNLFTRRPSLSALGLHRNMSKWQAADVVLPCMPFCPLMRWFCVIVAVSHCTRLWS